MPATLIAGVGTASLAALAAVYMAVVCVLLLFNAVVPNYISGYMLGLICSSFLRNVFG